MTPAASLPRAAVTAALAGVASRQLLHGALRTRRHPEAGGGSAASPAGSSRWSARWDRTNHRGEPISLLEGPAFVGGALLALAAAPGASRRVRCAALLAGGSAGLLGAYDDLAEQQVRKGLAGHLGALTRGEVTTGAVKVLGLAASGLGASALVGSAARTRRGTVVDALVGGAVVAGSANLLNLLDLRPGRAVKATLLAVPFTAAGLPVAAAAGGAGVGVLSDDLAERSMLGDTGANAAGALLGVAALVGRGRAGRVALLSVLVALTAASERVSFTRVIERTPLLRELDRWGRRPGAPGR